MVIEHLTFRLKPGASQDEFLKADKAMQEDFAPFASGFVRRTTARGQDGTWLVETFWHSLESADRAAAEAAEHASGRAMTSLIEPGSVAIRRYETLD